MTNYLGPMELIDDGTHFEKKKMKRGIGMYKGRGK